MLNSWIIRTQKAFYDPDRGTMPIIGLWQGELDALCEWLEEQDHPLHELEAAPIVNFGVMIDFNLDPNRTDRVTDILGADLDELSSYDHEADWQPLG